VPDGGRKRTEPPAALEWNDIAPALWRCLRLVRQYAKDRAEGHPQQIYNARTPRVCDNLQVAVCNQHVNLPGTPISTETDVAQARWLEASLETTGCEINSPRPDERWGAFHIACGTPRPEFRSAYNIENQRGGLQHELDAQGWRSTPVVSQRVSKPDGHRLHVPAARATSRRWTWSAARWRGHQGVNISSGRAWSRSFSNAWTSPARGRQQITTGYELGFCDATAGGPSCSAAARQRRHTLKRQLRSAGRPQPDQFRFCDAHTRPNPLTTQLKFAGSYETPVVGHPDERLAAKRSLASRCDNWNIARTTRDAARLQGARVRWRAGDPI